MSEFEEYKDVFRPEDVYMGTMKVDPEKCTGCGRCEENCLFRTWVMGDDKLPRFKKGAACFSCYNCMVACAEGAISIEEPYNVASGFWATLPGKLSPVKPLQPQDAGGKPDRWTEVERTIFIRRSVRNFRDKPVPETLIRRVVEAGRHAPSGGNSQPWKFIVVSDPKLIDEMNEMSYRVIKGLYDTYRDEEKVKMLAKGYARNPDPALWDPRIILGGIGVSVLERIKPVLLGAPAVIIIAGDRRAIGGPDLQVGICGQNMVLAATSLGLGATWVGFVGFLNTVPSMLEKLGIKEPFSILSSVVLGYPRFKQHGIVPREYRPITWIREGVNPEIEETPPLPEVEENE